MSDTKPVKTVGSKLPLEPKPLPSLAMIGSAASRVEEPKKLPNLAMINFDGIWHEIQKFASRSVCGKELNSRKMRLATADALPIGGHACSDCAAKKLEFEKVRKNRQLNRRFEDHKAWVQQTAGQKKNTLKRKQVFKKSDRFEM